jgi:hypothetical protein
MYFEADEGRKERKMARSGVENNWNGIKDCASLLNSKRKFRICTSSYEFI